MKLKLMLVALATLISSSTYAFGPGFEVGAGVTAATVGFRTRDDHINLPDVDLFEYYSKQQSVGANLFARYSTCWCIFPLAVQLDGYMLPSDAEYRYFWYINSFSRSRCRTIVDLSLKPGYLITDCILVEAKGGISWAHFRHEIDQRDTDLASVDRDSDSRTRLGYVFGVAMHVEVRSCLSAYAAFDWHAFSGDLGVASAQLRPTPDPSDRLTSKLTRAYARTFTLGLSWSI
jgi:opacity protein-like surface antigen